MPTAPKSKNSTPDVIVWNRGRTDGNGIYRVGVITLNYQTPDGAGRATPVIHPIRPGLDAIPRAHWERAMADAKAVGPKHMLSKAVASGRLSVVDLTKMTAQDVTDAIDQTASKRMLKGIAEGRIQATERAMAHAVQVIETWGRKDISRIRKITSHFGSFSRASES